MQVVRSTGLKEDKMTEICLECGNQAKRKEEECSLCDGTGKAKVKASKKQYGD